MFLLVPAYLGSAGQKAVKRLCVCVCACVCVRATAKPYTSQTNDHCIRRNIHVFFHSVLGGQILHLEID